MARQAAANLESKDVVAYNEKRRDVHIDSCREGLRSPISAPRKVEKTYTRAPTCKFSTRTTDAHSYNGPV